MIWWYWAMSAVALGIVALGVVVGARDAGFES